MVCDLYLWSMTFSNPTLQSLCSPRLLYVFRFRRSVYVPPRKSIVPSQASTGQSGRPRLSIMASRKSTFGLKVPGRRVSILQQQRGNNTQISILYTILITVLTLAVGPVQFEIDDNATRSILTNQGVADDPETRAGSLVSSPFLNDFEHG